MAWPCRPRHGQAPVRDRGCFAEAARARSVFRREVDREKAARSRTATVRLAIGRTHGPAAPRAAMLAGRMLHSMRRGLLIRRAGHPLCPADEPIRLAWRDARCPRLPKTRGTD